MEKGIIEGVLSLVEFFVLGPGPEAFNTLFRHFPLIQCYLVFG
jgi:hypothetical protein